MPWLIFLAIVPNLFGQTDTGNIVGRITDASGAVVSGAEVTAFNPAKGITSRSTSDGQGMYRFLYLEPATYTLTFKLAGFNTLERSGIALRSNDTVSVDVELTVGTLAERVEVSAAPPLLEAATSTTGTVIAGSQMNTLPMTERKNFQIMYILPGVTTDSGVTFHVAGLRVRALGYTMDGIPAKDAVRGGISTEQAQYTTPNAVEEVKVVTTVLPAETGHAAGGIMTSTYKSGTNQAHMEMEFRDMLSALRHREFFQLAPRTTPFGYYNPAALFSGPVHLPKIYSGRNRTFFLVGFTQKYLTSEEEGKIDVPTPEMLNGDFSFNGLGYPIYDPASTRQDASAKWIRDPFPGNIIPKSRFDPVVNKFLSFQPWKLPNNFAGAAFMDRTGPHRNYGGSNGLESHRTSWDAKADHNFSEKNRLSGRYSQLRNRAWFEGNQMAMNWDLLNNVGKTVTPSDHVNVAISDTHIFGPNLINELRLGANHRKESYTPVGLNENWAQKLGLPGVSGVTFPSFFNSGGGQFYNAAMPGGAYYRVSESYMLQDNVTFIRTGHVLKAGYELLRTRANTVAASTPAGVYRFGGTDFPFTPNTGNDFAAFLLGSVVRADFNTQLANWLPRWSTHALFLQDDWAATRKLTLNTGLRWSYETPFHTKHGQQSQFDPTATDPLTGRPGAITHPNGALARTRRNNFQPRVGGAYKVTNKVVFRGGFGLSMIDVFTNGFDQNFEEYFTSVTKQSPSGDPRPAFFLSQGPGPIQYQILPNGTSPFVGVNYSARNATWYDPMMRNPYSMNWNASIQYEFVPTWLLDLSYQGSAAVGLLNSWNINAVPLDISKDRAVLDQIYQNTQAYKPYPQFGSINLWSNFGHSTYHSGTVKVEKRFSTGLNMTSFYTWGKAIDEADSDGSASGVTYYNRRLEKGRAGYDITHRFVTYATYALPIGRERRWMHRGGWLDYALGGWNLSWVQMFQSSVPVSFTVGGSPYRYLPGVARPNQLVPNSQMVVKPYHLGDRFNNDLKNPAWRINAFSYPAAYTLGTLGRNTVDGTAGLIWSMGSLAKNIRIGEKSKLDIRFDVQNLFKRPMFQNPVSVVNLTNPGTFGKPTVDSPNGWCCLGGPFVGTIGAKFYF